jgi:hypothetical protein
MKHNQNMVGRKPQKHNQNMVGRKPQKQADWHPLMSALAPKADMVQHNRDVRFVPCVDGSELARDIFTFGRVSRCSHVFGLFARFT